MLTFRLDVKWVLYLLDKKRAWEFVSSVHSVKVFGDTYCLMEFEESSLTLFFYQHETKASLGGTCRQKEKRIMIYRITVKSPKNTNGVRIERGMSVDVVTNSLSDPVSTNGGQVVADAFMRIYGIDIKKAGALSRAWLDVERIG